ncbi:MAG TPA: hypothetical protein VFN78_01500 [Ktedonobacterales bacterium]|nr:hypothetical protein [Ktedonobacterales bacterium]
MRDEGERFTYTAQRESYLVMVGALIFLLVVETGLWVLLIGALVHNGAVQLALHALMAAATLLSLVWLLAPAFTAHHLSATDLTLRYGFFTARLPRAVIASATAQHGVSREAQPLLPRYDEKQRRLMLSFSDAGQVVLLLREPYPLRMGRRERRIESVLLNVDHRDDLLAALNTGASLAPQPPLASGAESPVR